MELIIDDFLFLGYILLNIACGFLYGLVYGMLFIIIYVSIGLSVSFLICRYILTHNFCIIKNLKATFENSEIIQTLVKVLNSADGYKIIFISRLTPVSDSLFMFKYFSHHFISIDSSWTTKWILLS